MKNPRIQLKLTFLFLGFFICLLTQAQNYTLNFGPVYITSQDTSSFLNTKGVDIINTGTTTLSNITYTLLLKDTLNDCKFELCESSNCMGNLDSNGVIIPLAPGEKGWLQIHFWSGKTYGINRIKYLIKNGNQSDTLSWVLKVEQLTGISESEIQKNQIQVFPNPANSFIDIKGKNLHNSEFILTDIFGKIVRQENLYAENNRFNTELIPQGMYFFRIKNSSSTIRSGKILIAH